ncbi:MAG: putative dehydrogenase [Verrucomicrobiales bacterium]|jgi:predicted dehydrogenase
MTTNAFSPYPVNFGLIGAGGIAQAYADAFIQSKRADLIAVADVSEKNANTLAEKCGAKAYKTHTEMLDAHPDLDAVLICTPPNTHADIACEAASRGINVLCEKPLSIKSSEARRMATAAEKHDVILTMASKFRYVQDVEIAKNFVDSGKIGDVILFENAFTGFVDMSTRWNSVPAISGGGVLIDNGTHSLDLTRYFLGPIADLEVIEGLRTQNLPVEETVNICARSESGAIAQIDLSWTINKSLPHYIRIFGTKGEIFLGWQESKIKTDGDWEVFGTGYDKTDAFLNQLNNFAAAIRDEEQLVITAEDGIASVEAIEAAYQSLKKENFEPIIQAKFA